MIDIKEKHTLFENGLYTYDVMEKQMNRLTERYPFIKQSVIGKSIEGRNIYCIQLGIGKRKIHINAAHHANEWITALVVMRSLEIMCYVLTKKGCINHFNMEHIFQKVTYDFVPMVNPDGVELSVYSKKIVKNKPYLIQYNEGSMDFTRWKANINGVDLNRNYDAGFLEYVLGEKLDKPSYAYYQGERPESEPETKALADLTRNRDYDMVFAYHTQGEVIYWNYKDIILDYCKLYADIFSKASGYLLDIPEQNAASGGYKDWFIKAFNKPGFTIECGYGENPITISQLDSIVKTTIPILVLASRKL